MSERAWSFSDSLEEAIQKTGGAVDLMADLGVAEFTDVPDEFTHWIEEQKSWRDSVGLMDQSYHMTDLTLEGPDAIELLSDYAVNNFEGFEPGKAKQLVTANPNGYFIGDAILFHLEDEKFLTVGAKPANHWLLYNAETGDYDVEASFQPRAVSMDDDPQYYRYQVQGPDAIDVMQEAVDDELPEIGFFNFEELTIDGHEVNVLRHGMAGEAGFEFFGPYEEGDAVRDAVLEAGEEYDITRVGGVAYQTPNIILGWVPLVLPAIFDDEMQDYREWLDVGQGLLSIGGSFRSDDITDYYFTPPELGYDHIIDTEGDYCGSDALQEELESDHREKVTLVWDDEDVVDVFASLFSEGDTYQFMELPHPRWAACPYDEVKADGEHVGVSTDKSYIYNRREMLSLASVDPEYAEPGTEVTLVWGDPEDSDNPVVEDHVQKEITATVQPSPYSQDRR